MNEVPKKKRCLLSTPLFGDPVFQKSLGCPSPPKTQWILAPFQELFFFHDCGEKTLFFFGSGNPGVMLFVYVIFFLNDTFLLKIVSSEEVPVKESNSETYIFWVLCKKSLIFGGETAHLHRTSMSFQKKENQWRPHAHRIQLSNEKKTPGCLGDLLGMTFPTQLCRDYFLHAFFCGFNWEFSRPSVLLQLYQTYHHPFFGGGGWGYIYINIYIYIHIWMSIVSPLDCMWESSAS